MGKDVYLRGLYRASGGEGRAKRKVHYLDTVTPQKKAVGWGVGGGGKVKTCKPWQRPLCSKSFKDRKGQKVILEVLCVPIHA